MTAATHTNNGRTPTQTTESVINLGRPAQPVAAIAKQLELPYVFTDTVLRYLLRVLPCVTSELAHWRARAAEIPDPELRRQAQASLGKHGNIEGAALFATLAPAAQRRRTVRALVAFQTAYNYLDALSEQPSEDPLLNGEQLHQALLTALHPTVAHADYYARSPRSEDGGYLNGIVDACRDALAGLPSYALLAPRARVAAARIVDFQALNLSDAHGGHVGLERWATEATPPGSGVAWWETAAAAGSSLAVHALIAAAADPDLDPAEIAVIDRAYFPWIGALHSLLDSLVDRGEDHQHGQRSLLDYYPSPTTAAVALSSLALRARAGTRSLPNRNAHRVILTAMCSYYLSAPQCYTAEAHRITRALTDALGAPLSVAIALFRTRRMLATIAHGSYT
jgi:tetraprenyl-beta-curcumene synthase